MKLLVTGGAGFIGSAVIRQAQIEQFKSMPRAQQEALAGQYGVDLNSIGASVQQNQRPKEVDVVEPIDAISDEERDRAREERENEEEQDRKTAA